jgi:hypothetical protein
MYTGAPPLPLVPALLISLLVVLHAPPLPAPGTGYEPQLSAKLSESGMAESLATQRL